MTDRDQSGVALIMTVSVIALVLALVAASETLVLTDTAESRRANAMAADQIGAAAGADEFFSHLVRDPAYITGGSAAPYHDHPGVRGWVTLANGSLTPCADARNEVCYRLAVADAPQDGDSYAGAATVEVTAVTLCRHGPALDGSCLADRVHQRLRQRTFADYLWFDQLETLDPLLYPTPAQRSDAATNCATWAPSRPASCADVAFLGTAGGDSGPAGGDTTYGPMHTNDQSFYACLSPRFEPPVSRAGWPTTKTLTPDPTPIEAAGASVFEPASGNACNHPTPQFTPASQVTPVAGAPYYTFATDTSALAAVAGPDDSYQGTTTITLAGSAGGNDTYTAAPGAAPPGRGAAKPWPGEGVIYVTGDVYVSGAACQPVSIASTGTVYIDGDLTYPSGCDGARTGLEADDAVVVLPTDGPAGPAVNGAEDRTIEAAVLALGRHSCYGNGSPPPGVSCQPAGDPLRGGSFFVEGWDTARLGPADSAHALHFLGAIAGVFRGAFGAYDTATGHLLSGWSKDFAFDVVLRTQQPPWFLAPVGGGWVRTDVAETPAGA